MVLEIPIPGCLEQVTQRVVRGGGASHKSRKGEFVMRKALYVLVVLAVMAGPAAAQNIFSTGFEAPDYTVGPINGQNGWTVANSDPNAVVTDQWAASGTQGMAVGGTAGLSVVQPLTGGTSQLWFDIDMAKADQNTGQWWVVLQAPSGSARRSAMFGFNSGQIEYYSAGWHAYSAFVAGQTYHFQAFVDAGIKQWSLWLDGNPVSLNMPTAYANAVIPTEMYFYHSGNTGYGLADNISIVTPEPGSLAALALGIAMMGGMIRRRAR